MPNDQQPPNLNELPANLPRPKDDGGARHLKGMVMPDLELPSTADDVIAWLKKHPAAKG